MRTWSVGSGFRPRCPSEWASLTFFHARADVLGPLADPEFDHPRRGESTRNERVELRDRFDLGPVAADRQDDPAVARDLAAGGDEVAGRVVRVDEPHVGAHTGIEAREIGRVRELDDEHDGLIIAPRAEMMRGVLRSCFARIRSENEWPASELDLSSIDPSATSMISSGLVVTSDRNMSLD